MKGKALAVATAVASALLVAVGSGSAAAKKPPAPPADVWIESLTITCPTTGGLEVALLADASAETTINAGEVILTEMREVTDSDGFYPYTTSIPVAEWWETQPNPEGGPLAISFHTDDADFDSTTWDGDKHHFWIPALTGEEANEVAWFRARAWVDGRLSQNGPPGPGSWDSDEAEVYRNCLTGESFTPETPWGGWNYPTE